MTKPVRGRGVIDLRKRRPGIIRESLTIPFRRERESLRARRRKLRALGVAVLILIMAAVAYGISYLSYSPKLLISNVSVVGAKEVSPKVIRAYVETKLDNGTHPIISPKNIFLYPKGTIESAIKQYLPRIKEASISRENMLAQAIIVSVKEREPSALWCRKTSSSSSETRDCYFMDDTGFIFDKALPLSDKVYLVFTGKLASEASPIGQTFLPNRFSGVSEILKRLRDAGFEPREISVDNESDFSIQLSEGFVLKAILDADASALVRNLQFVISSDSLRGKTDKIEYIDLRFGNRVYYKNKN